MVFKTFHEKVKNTSENTISDSVFMRTAAFIFIENRPPYAHFCPKVALPSELLFSRTLIIGALKGT